MWTLVNHSRFINEQLISKPNWSSQLWLHLCLWNRLCCWAHLNKLRVHSYAKFVWHRNFLIEFLACEAFERCLKRNSNERKVFGATFSCGNLWQLAAVHGDIHIYLCLPHKLFTDCTIKICTFNCYWNCNWNLNWNWNWNLDWDWNRNGLKISDRTDSLWQSTAASMPAAVGQQRHAARSMQQQQQFMPQHSHQHQHQRTNANGQRANTFSNNYNSKMLNSNHSSQREISASPRRVALDTTASGSTTGFGFSRGKLCMQTSKLAKSSTVS